MKNEKDFNQAIIYYISGMTDNYAMETYNKITELIKNTVLLHYYYKGDDLND